MKTKKLKNKNKKKEFTFPVLVEKDEDNFYVVECPALPGCYSQGKTLDEALRNIHEVIKICLEEKENQKLLETYKEREFSFHTVAVGA